MIVRLVMLFIFAVFGLTMSYQMHRERKYGEESFTWPSTRANLQSTCISSMHGNPYVSARYNYNVNGNSYTGHKIQYCLDYSSRFIDYFQNNIMPKKEITIYYSPTNPSLSVIIPGVGSITEFQMDWLGIVFLILFLIVFLKDMYKIFSLKGEGKEPIEYRKQS